MINRKPPTFAELHDIYKTIYPEPVRGQHRIPRDENRTRMGRALSWLERCEKGINDDAMDERFLFLWIAFNAAYGDDGHMKSKSLDDPNHVEEHQKIGNFLQKIVIRDKTYRLADIIKEHGNVFRSIIDNRFLCNIFWKAEYFPRNRESWERNFESERKRAHEILDDQHWDAKQTRTVLHLAFYRLYTLRNQILHGNASWRDDYNRSSLESGDTILRLFIPEALRMMLDAMKDSPDTPDWGQNAYPPYLDTPDDTTKGPPPYSSERSIR